MNKFITNIIKILGGIIFIFSIVSLLRFVLNYAANSFYVDAHWSVSGYWSFQLSKFFSNLTLSAQFFGIAKILELFNKLKMQREMKRL